MLGKLSIYGFIPMNIRGGRSGLYHGLDRSTSQIWGTNERGPFPCPRHVTKIIKMGYIWYQNDQQIMLKTMVYLICLKKACVKRNRHLKSRISGGHMETTV